MKISSLEAAHTHLRRCVRVLWFCLVALALSVTPVRSGFEVRAQYSCELSAPLVLWVSGVANVRHLASYACLVVLGSCVFLQRPVVMAAVVVLAASALVELEQAVFIVGHCRLRDMLPNVLALGLGIGIVLSSRCCFRGDAR